MKRADGEYNHPSLGKIKRGRKFLPEPPSSEFESDANDCDTPDHREQLQPVIPADANQGEGRVCASDLDEYRGMVKPTKNSL